LKIFIKKFGKSSLISDKQLPENYRIITIQGSAENLKKASQDLVDG
jgi:hypothetical protein